MYATDMLTLPGAWLRRTRLWYARGRTWRQAAARTGTASDPVSVTAPRTDSSGPAPRRGGAALARAG
jgi:hypothetical protein